MSEVDKLDLDAIEKLAAAMANAPDGSDEKFKAHLYFLKDYTTLVPGLVARVRELEAERDALKSDLGDEIDDLHFEEQQSEDEIHNLTTLLRRVLAWRGLDGDGIDEPLRTEIEEAL